MINDCSFLYATSSDCWLEFSAHNNLVLSQRPQVKWNYSVNRRRIFSITHHSTSLIVFRCRRVLLRIDVSHVAMQKSTDRFSGRALLFGRSHLCMIWSRCSQYFCNGGGCLEAVGASINKSWILSPDIYIFAAGLWIPLRSLVSFIIIVP